MDDSKINTREATALVLTVAVAHSLLELPKSLLVDQKSAVILNLIYISFIALGLVYLIYKLFKKFPGKDIMDISDFLGGKALKNTMGILFMGFFCFTASILLRNFCESIKIVYFPNTKVEFIITMFIAAIMISCSLNFKANIKTNHIVMPLVLISMVFLFFSNFKNFSTERMYPLLGDGIYNTFILGLGNLYAFGGIALLYFLPPLLKEPKNFKKVAIYSIILSAIYLIITVSIILFMFAYFINVDEIMPLFSAARHIEFGSFFQRLESIFLLIWMIIFACYISILMSFSSHIFQKIFVLKDEKPLILPLGLLFLGISLIPKDYAISAFFETHVYAYLVNGIILFLGITILLLANLKLRKVGDYNKH